jgi:hypothetical protein
MLKFRSESPRGATFSLNPRLFEFRKASEPCSRWQWDSAFEASPAFPEGDVWYVGALEPPVCSIAHGLQCRRPRSLPEGTQLLSD